MDSPAADQGNHARVADPSTWPEHIKRRYGLHGSRRRRGLLVSSVIAVLVLPFMARTAWVASNGQGVLTMPAFHPVSARQVDLTLVYAKKTGTFTCAMRAQDTARVDVGFAYLVLRPGPTRTWHFALQTLDSAVVAEVIGCQRGVGTDHLPPPQFAPGVKPARQSPPGITPRTAGGFATVAP